MASLYLPPRNLVSFLFADKGVSEEQPIWIDGQTCTQRIDKAQTRDLVRRLASGYMTTGLVRPQTLTPSVVVMYSENQPMLFPNILAVIAAGGTVATCPWQASVKELLYRVKILRPTAIVCSESSLNRALEARRKAGHTFEVLIQNSRVMEVARYDSGDSLVSHHPHDWDEAWNEEIASKPSVIVFSSGTTGYPKGLISLTISQLPRH